METFIAWVLTVLVAIAPPGEPTKTKTRYEYEPKEELLERYASIAKDLAEVVSEEEPLFKGPQGKARTAALLLSIARFESGLKKEVDKNIGKWARGDSGRSWCLMQINIGKGTVPWGNEEMRTWTGPDLISDRKKCFRAGLTRIRASLGQCRHLSNGDQLSGYTSGGCKENEAYGRRRWSLAWQILGKHPLKLK